MKTIRVLMVIGCMNLGGAETMIMNIYRCIDRQKVQFDFLVHNDSHGEYEDEIIALGGCIYRIERYMVCNYFSYVKQLNAHFTAHPEHKIVHCHIGSSAAVCLGVAKKYGAVTIAHSHNMRSSEKNIRSVLWRAVSYPTRYIANYFFACSPRAASDRYGKRISNSDRCRVIYNGINCQRFAFNSENRKAIRNQYNMDGCFVVGHVGRHSAQKNPLFLLDIFSEVYKKDKTARLLQVGQGEMTDQLRQRCRELGIEDVVIFAGAHLDIEKYYSAMDIFIFPSLYEGLGMVVIEAQTNGVLCLLSEAVPQLADIDAGLYHTMNYSSTAESWAENILKYKQKQASHEIDAARKAEEMGWDVVQTAKQLEQFYIDGIFRDV